MTVGVNGVRAASAEVSGLAPRGRVRLSINREGDAAARVEFRSIRVRPLPAGDAGPDAPVNRCAAVGVRAGMEDLLALLAEALAQVCGTFRRDDR